MKQIYLDYAATTPVDKAVLASMQPYFSEVFANPSSIHSFGQRAKASLEKARSDIATILGCKTREIIFTSGGTESANLAVRGIAKAYEKKGKHIISSTIEHKCVLESLENLEQEGFEVTYLRVDKNGIINPAELIAAIRPDTILCSIIYANNEIGTIQDIKGIAKICKQNNVLTYTDACQAAGALEINVAKLGTDLMTLNSSKIYGPKGAGLLFKKEGVKLEPLMLGGIQEKGMRAGTENIPAIIGFAKALEIAENKKTEEAKRLSKLRDFFIKEILTNIDKTSLNGHKSKRLPNNINISFNGLEGETILIRLDMEGIAVSAGSACASGSLDPSHVVMALGVPLEVAHSSVRFTLGRTTSMADLKIVLKKLKKITKELQEFSPLF